MSFRKYLLQCERKKVKPSVSRKNDDVWCEVLAFKNQYAPPDFEGIRKDVSKAKVFDMQTNRSIWVRFSILEKDWKWRMEDE